MKHKRQRLTVFLILWILLVCAVFTPAMAEKTGKIHGGWLILRSSPSTSGKQISSYPTGTEVKILSESGKWYEVETPDGLTGFMLASYITVEGQEITPGEDAWVTSKNGLNVRLRSGPGTNYSPIASYAPGTKCTILSVSGDFAQIKIGTITGYMMKKFLTGKDPGSGGGSSGTILYDVWVTSSNGGGVNLRSSATKANNVIGFYAVGTKGGMITPGITWSLISIDGKQGYMMTQFLTMTEPIVVPTTGSYVTSANGKSVNLRNGAGLNYTIIASYPPGTALTVLTSGTEWSFIKINGTYGYMMSKYIVTK